nr:cytochrome P450 CYP72A219-like [Tanacetum cinerariifolium]
EIKEDGVGMSMDDVIEECKLFYGAGSETTSNLIVWTMVCLSLHQEWQTKAREEIMNIFGGRDIHFEGLKHLKIMTMILNEIWGKDATEFKPERFSQGVANATKLKGSNNSFIPFAGGPRVCIGQNFAMIEAKVAIGKILQRFSFKLSPSYEHSPFPTFTLPPQFGAKLILPTVSKVVITIAVIVVLKLGWKLLNWACVDAKEAREDVAKTRV